SPGDGSAAWSPGLQQHKKFWKDRSSDFLAEADSGSSSAAQLHDIDQAGFPHWSVSCNQWTSVPERTAAAPGDCRGSSRRTGRARSSLGFPLAG
ncbi:MAG TPA: hypothetical protein VI136_06530, partial [Verrucomicrobiae bacterium]